MTIKVNTNPNFKLELKADIDLNLKCITILVILDNLNNKKRQMKTFKGNELPQAIEQYEAWEQFIF